MQWKICAEKELEYTINPDRVGGRKTENLKLRCKTELIRRKSDGNL